MAPPVPTAVPSQAVAGPPAFTVPDAGVADRTRAVVTANRIRPTLTRKKRVLAVTRATFENDFVFIGAFC